MKLGSVIGLIVGASIVGFVLYAMIDEAKQDKAISTRDDWGTIVDVQPLATSWNEARKTTVKTTKGTFVVVGSPAIRSGARVEIITMQSRRRFANVDGEPFMFGVCQ